MVVVQQAAPGVKWSDLEGKSRNENESDETFENML
jgi:hypothetical protein